MWTENKLLLALWTFLETKPCPYLSGPHVALAQDLTLFCYHLPSPHFPSGTLMDIYGLFFIFLRVFHPFCHLWAKILVFPSSELELAQCGVQSNEENLFQRAGCFLEMSQHLFLQADILDFPAVDFGASVDMRNHQLLSSKALYCFPAFPVSHSNQQQLESHGLGGQ